MFEEGKWIINLINNTSVTIDIKRFISDQYGRAFVLVTVDDEYYNFATVISMRRVKE